MKFSAAAAFALLTSPATAKGQSGNEQERILKSKSKSSKSSCVAATEDFKTCLPCVYTFEELERLVVNSKNKKRQVEILLCPEVSIEFSNEIDMANANCQISCPYGTCVFDGGGANRLFQAQSGSTHNAVFEKIHFQNGFSAVSFLSFSCIYVMLRLLWFTANSYFQYIVLSNFFVAFNCNPWWRPWWSSSSRRRNNHCKGLLLSRQQATRCYTWCWRCKFIM